MLIDGKEAESVSGEYIRVENPSHRGRTAFEVPKANEEDVDRAVRSARKAFREWSGTTWLERSDLFYKMARALEEETEELAVTMATESGNAIRTQSGPECRGMPDKFKYLAGLAAELKGSVYPGLNREYFHYSRRVPIGVIAGIIPWNSPATIASSKIGESLIAGNTAVIKAPSQTPRTPLRIAKILNRFLPPGAVNVITGPGSTSGMYLAKHPGIGRISLTGSTDVGREMLRASADRILSTTLELGGKNPQIVFPDAAPSKIADGVIGATRITRNGESCSSGSRIYAHRSVIDELCGEIAKRFDALKVGDALDPENDIGAITGKNQYEKVVGYIEYGLREAGSECICGGLPPADGPLAEGYFVRPTLFRCRPDSRLVKEEIFGPVITVVPWEDEAEVLEMANDTEYGLTGYVWSADVNKAMKFAHAMETGWIMINAGGMQLDGQPYGGFKSSGIGREHSLEGILSDYTELQSITVNMGF
jgi:betaine-aldehyde dehydrogenase